MLRWLIEVGSDVNNCDEFGDTPLMTAVGCDDLNAVEILIAAGARIDVERNGDTVLTMFKSREVGQRLLAAGADPRFLSYEGQRLLLGLPAQADDPMIEVSESDYRKGRARRFGASNPERMHEPFWQEMIRTGVDAFQAASQFDDESHYKGAPVWCAHRFGQSITFLPDGRIIQVGGEHEDSYDPNFCIYNDVFVHQVDGTVEIYGYPESIFPPTDFHTATLIDDRYIYLLGSLGYGGSRRFGDTQVYRLDIASMKMESIPAEGEIPGWISRHSAQLISGYEIEIIGGQIAVLRDDKQSLVPNEDAFVLDTKLCQWRRIVR